MQLPLFLTREAGKYGASWTPIAEAGYPSHIMPAIHLPKCNWRCPYCLNRSLSSGAYESVSPPLENAFGLVNDLHSWREKRLMISGGEPFCTPWIEELLRHIGGYGIERYVATNGSMYERIRQVALAGLVEHFVVDIKAPLVADAYSEVTGVAMDAYDIERLKAAFRLMSLDEAPWTCEFRTTVCGKFLNLEALEDIADFIGYDSVYTLQLYTTHQTASTEMADSSYVVPYDQLLEWAAKLQRKVFAVNVREV